MATYSYSILTDFDNASNVNLFLLRQQINNDPSITIECYYANRYNDIVVLFFVSVLPGPDEIYLEDTLIAGYIFEEPPAFNIGSSGANDTTMLLQSNQTEDRLILLPDADTSLVGTSGSTFLNKEIVIFDNTNGNIISGSGVRYYGKLSSNPILPTPQNGDKYFNTTIGREFLYYNGDWIKNNDLVFQSSATGPTGAIITHDGSNYIGVQVTPSTVNLQSVSTYGYGKLLFIKDETGKANGSEFITISPTGSDKIYFNSGGDIVDSGRIDSRGGLFLFIGQQNTLLHPNDGWYRI